MASTPTTNLSYNKPAVGDRGWGTTMNANLDSIDTDLGSEHQSGGAHGPKVTINQTNADNALEITTLTDQAGVLVQSTGNPRIILERGGTERVRINATSNLPTITGNGGLVLGGVTDTEHARIDTSGNFGVGVSSLSARLHAIQTANADAFIFGKTGAGSGTFMTLTNQGTGIGLNITQTAPASDHCIRLQSNSTVASEPIVKFRSDGGSDVLELENNSGGLSLDVNHASATTTAIDVDCSNASYSGVAVNINQSGSGDLLNLQTDGSTIFEVASDGYIGMGSVAANSSRGINMAHSFGPAGATGVYGVRAQMTRTSSASSGSGIFVYYSESPEVDVTGETVDRVEHAHFENMTLTAGTVTTQAGLVIDPLTGASNNYGFLVEGNNACGIGTASPAALLEVQQTAEANAFLVDGQMSGNIDVLSVSNSGTGASCHLAPTANPTTAVLQVDHTTTGAGAGIQVLNSGTGNALFIDQDGNGRGIDVDNVGSGVGVRITQGGDANALLVRQTSAVSSTVFRVNNAGTGAGAFIDQDGDGVALEIDSEATSADCIDVACLGSGAGLQISHAGTGQCIDINSSSSGHEIHVQNTDSAPQMRLVSGTGQSPTIAFGDTDDANIGRIIYDNTNDSMDFYTNASVAVTIDSQGDVGIGTTGPNTALEVNAGTNATITVESTTTGSGILDLQGIRGAVQNQDIGRIRGYWNGTAVAEIRFNTGQDTGNMDDGRISLMTSEASGSVEERMRIEPSGEISIGDEAVLGTSILLGLKQTAAAVGLVINQDGAGDAFRIDNDGGADGVEINQNDAGDALEINIQSTDSTAAIDVNQTTTGAMDVIDVINSGTGTAVNINQDGNGKGIHIDNAGTGVSLDIDQTGDGNCMLLQKSAGSATMCRVDASGGSAICLNINNSGSGNSIRCDDSNDDTVFRVQDDGRVSIGDTAPDSSVQLHIFATSGGKIVLQRDDQTPLNGENYGVIEFKSNDSTHSTQQVAGRIIVENNTTVQASNPQSSMQFVVSEGSAGLTTPMVIRCDNDVYETIGRVGIGTSNPSSSAHVEITSTATSGTELFIDYNGTGSGDVFNIQSLGSGKYIDTNAGGGGAELTNGGTWTDGCSIAIKENFEEVDNQAILASLKTLPVEKWNYITDREKNIGIRHYDMSGGVPGIKTVEDKTPKHIGPTAELFMQAFGVGESTKSIWSGDTAGVALAAIKGLLERIETLEAEVDALKNA